MLALCTQPFNIQFPTCAGLVKPHCDNNECSFATSSRRKRFSGQSKESLVENENLDLVKAQQVFQRIKRKAQFIQQFAAGSNSQHFNCAGPAGCGNIPVRFEIINYEIYPH